jgi:hypothetical protein
MSETEIFHGIQYIALYMGWKTDKLHTYLLVRYPQTGAVTGIAYNEDWNLLMPVVQKIDRFLDENLLDEFWSAKGISWKHSRFKMMNIATPIETVFEEVVKFIKWYDETRSTNVVE